MSRPDSLEVVQSSYEKVTNKQTGVVPTKAERTLLKKLRGH